MTTRSEDKMYRLLCDTINKVATGQATIKEAELMADLAKLVKENNRLREQCYVLQKRLGYRI